MIYKQGAGTHVKVYNAQLIGQKPWKGTETTDLKAGMMSKDSALFASDHRGVVVDFEFSCSVCFIIVHFSLYDASEKTYRRHSQVTFLANGGRQLL